jgi:hypothetical protein
LGSPQPFKLVSRHILIFSRVAFFWPDAVFHEASMLITGSDRWKQALIPY